MSQENNMVVGKIEQLTDTQYVNIPAIEPFVIWRTMDTAPKDGTTVDLWLKERDGYGWRAIDCHWDNKLGWVTSESEKIEDYFAFVFESVSHWMKSPEPPAI